MHSGMLETVTSVNIGLDGQQLRVVLATLRRLPRGWIER
jgi:hypothetical protein